jgi:phosphohistidine swiveling domain-containing protein
MKINISELKKSFRSQSWYYQATAVKLIYAGYPWRACFDFTLKKKKSAVFYRGLLVFYRKNYFEVFFISPQMQKIADLYYSRQLSDPRFIQRLRQNWELGPVADLKREIVRLRQTEPNRIKWLIEFKKISRLYDAVWRESIFLDSFDAAGEELLQGEIKKHGLTLNQREIQTLTSLPELSSLQQEKISLLSLTAAAKNNSELKKMILNGNLIGIKIKHSKFFRQLKTHAEKYYWIVNDYAVIRNLNETHFLRQIAEYLAAPEKITSEMNLLPKRKQIESEKRRIYRQHRIKKDLISLIDFLLELAKWRNQRKDINQLTSSAINLLVKEYARRFRVPLAKIEKLFWWELIDLAKGKNKIFDHSVKRETGAFFYDSPMKNKSAFYGQAAISLARQLNKSLITGKDIYGQSAYPGKVYGQVRIIRTQKEFYKMKLGDILVAPNTRPEYMPIMKSAAAIVTDEGGLTSHAAIVSRELKIPSIVGTKTATRQLKDGDLVEVNANSGTVKIISNK